MRVVQLFVTLLLFLPALAQPEQKVLVNGQVKDWSTGIAVPFASVQFDDIGVACDMDGRFSKSIYVGSYQVRVRAVGYVPVDTSVTIGINEQPLILLLKPSKTQLDAIVVTAGRFEQRLSEVPASLDVIRPELIENKSVTTLQDAIDQTPGVIVVDNDPQIRGSSGYSFGAGSRVMIMIDDLPVLSGDIGRPSWSFLPIENVEQVEVIKGASSVLYGSAALSGVINLRTAYPKDEPTTRVSMLGGVYDAPGQTGTKWWDENRPTYAGLDFMHSRRLGNVDLVIGGNWFSNTGYIGPEPVPADSIAQDPLRLGPGGYEHRVRMNVGLRWRNKKVPGLSYGLATNAMDNRNSSVLAWNDVDTGLFRPYPGTVTRTEQINAYVDPFITYLTKNGVKHSLRTRFYYLDNQNDNEQSNTSSVIHTEYQFQRDVNLFGPTKVTIGLMNSVTQAESKLFAGNEDGSGESDASNQAAYMQLDRKFWNERVNLSAGVRYEQFRVNEDEESVPVFRSGVNFKAAQQTFFRASYGQGFRFPTIGERFIRTSVGALNIYPSFDLVPEKSWTMEIGVKQGFRLAGFEGYVDVVHFRQKYEDYIEFTFGQWGDPADIANLLGLGFRSVNTGDASINGYEMEVAGRGAIGNWDIMLLAGYTYTLPISESPDEVYAEPTFENSTWEPATYANTSYDATDNILKYRVQNLLRFDIQLDRGKWGGGLSARYNSHVQNIDLAFVALDDQGIFPTGARRWMEEHTSGDLLLDVRLMRQLSESLKLSFIVDNLTNRVYSVRPLYIEAPRSFTFRFTYRP